ncbi:GNAT family N-acetyltransferase [Paenibacillus agricola]|uniref:GNAT family N-acetyltransferase n=1 Tax=Paenibacillus agricola TaxID=2716264 RepID=A0ABX0J397_9BACL|nr:GNAT family N-acetyltransferase [Paenibacillus agricola]NHN30617.1 GNAT family N-acetyltransferase [Paenibacillus agricola]
MILLQTARLFLRPYTHEDIHALYPIFSDAVTMQYYPAAFSLQQTQTWIQRNIERYNKDGFGLWAVCLQETKQCIGDCGLIKQQIQGKTEIEVGYHISKAFWSNGYATEAALACRDFGFEQMGVSKLVSIIDPRNTASIRVAEKIGFTKEQEAIIFNKNHCIYAGFKANE